MTLSHTQYLISALLTSTLDITDARQAGKPLMVGWNTEHTCGPIPAGTTNVRLIKGDKIKKDFVSFDITGGQQGNIKMTNNGGNVKFSGLKVKISILKNDHSS